MQAEICIFLDNLKGMFFYGTSHDDSSGYVTSCRRLFQKCCFVRQHQNGTIKEHAFHIDFMGFGSMDSEKAAQLIIGWCLSIKCTGFHNFLSIWSGLPTNLVTSVLSKNYLFNHATWPAFRRALVGSLQLRHSIVSILDEVQTLPDSFSSLKQLLSTNV